MMSIPINHQVITHQGVPVAVVVPYEEYAIAFAVKSSRKNEEPTVPHEIAVRVLKEQISPIRAWREHLGLTQASVAARINVSQSAFAQMEAPDGKPRMSTVKKIAEALGLSPAQLRW